MVSCHIPLAFWQFPHKRVTLFSILTVLGKDSNVLNSLNNSRLSHDRERMQNNVTQTKEEWTRIQEDRERNVTRINICLYSYLIVLNIHDSGNGAVAFCSYNK